MSEWMNEEGGGGSETEGRKNDFFPSSVGDCFLSDDDTGSKLVTQEAS